jgi:hypothetical protein
MARTYEGITGELRMKCRSIWEAGCESWKYFVPCTSVFFFFTAQAIRWLGRCVGVWGRILRAITIAVLSLLPHLFSGDPEVIRSRAMDIAKS